MCIYDVRGPEWAALSAEEAQLLFCSGVTLCLPVTLYSKKQGAEEKLGYKFNPTLCLQKAALCIARYPDSSPSYVAVRS